MKNLVFKKRGLPKKFLVIFYIFSIVINMSSSGIFFIVENAEATYSTPNWNIEWQFPSCSVDPKDDEHPNEIDIFGDTKPAVGYAKDSEYYYFREKLNDSPKESCPGCTGYKNSAWVVLFQLSGNNYQYLLSVNGKPAKASDESVELWKNTSGGDYLSFDPILVDPAEDKIWSGSASFYSKAVSVDGDNYIMLAIPKYKLELFGINLNTTKFFATSEDSNNFNKDHLNCYDTMTDLSIAKTSNVSTTTCNENFSYTVTVTNNGPAVASNVTVTDNLPLNFTIDSVTPSQGICNDITGPDIACQLGSINNKSYANVTIAGKVHNSGLIINKASVTSDNFEINTANNLTRLAIYSNSKEEICDGIDNDCDGSKDEDFNLGEECIIGTGACANKGITVCTSAGNGTKCNVDAKPSSKEICDNIDNDCDGQIDEDFTDLGKECNAGVGKCANSGKYVCSPDHDGLVCNASPFDPSPESCNGEDDNCDGQIDEGNPGGGESCSTLMLGICSNGHTNCSSGAIVCIADFMEGEKMETCNGLDDDCDGLVDEDLPAEIIHCGNGICANEGLKSCVDGKWSESCEVKPGIEVEICINGLDDNCDGTVDEGCECNEGDSKECGLNNIGMCKYGVQTCSDGKWGICGGAIYPSDEICDGLDNNCNGQIDEGYDIGNVCKIGFGTCESTGIKVCNASGDGTKCDAEEILPEAEKCNGLDDNCNGQEDEDFDGLGEECKVGIGKCFNTGVYVCNADGDDLLCNVDPFDPSTEICNGEDDNCDGDVDEGNPGGGGECSTLIPGICSSGHNECSLGGLVCKPDVMPNTNMEICNGIDDDCDGFIDEDLPTEETSCGLGSCARTGIKSCVGGKFVDTCEPGSGYGKELCINIIDDDCDGSVDEGCECNSGDTKQCGFSDVGACEFGVQTCIDGKWGDCFGAIYSIDEKCDGLDNNCNGLIDDSFNIEQTCSLGIGACAVDGKYVCNKTQDGTYCDATPGEPMEEICGNGIDEDCNGNDSACKTCGDGIKNGEEQCDDGNKNNGDGCSSTCTLESIYRCEDLAEKTGWWAEYYNYPRSHPDMNLPGDRWPDDGHGDPLNAGWNTDWYAGEYLKFYRVDNNLSFGENFFPFDIAPEEIDSSHDYHFGVHWRAKVTASTTGEYNFSLTSDDDAWVYLDGILISDNKGIHAPTTLNGKMNLTGENIIDIYYAERHTSQSHFNFNFEDASNLDIIPFSKDCGPKPYSDLTVCKYIDTDGSIETVEDRSLATDGWLFTVSAEGLSLSATTTETGCYTFNKLTAGNYQVSETNKTGFKPIQPDSGNISIDLAADEPETVNFINSPFSNESVGSISGCKYNDQNNDGEIDEGEVKLPGWEVELWSCTYSPFPLIMAEADGEEPIVGACEKKSSVITGEDGCYIFKDLSAGYYKIKEVQKESWNKTFPTTEFYEVPMPERIAVTNKDFANHLNGSGSNPYCGDGILNQSFEECEGSVGLVAGYKCNSSCKLEKIITECVGDCGGHIITTTTENIIVEGEEGAPILTIKKSVILPSGFANLGDENIEFTVIVSNEGNLTAFNVNLRDLLPKELLFADGSQNDRSWELGDIEPGKSKEIVYKVNISKDAEPIVYKNIAEAKADNFTEAVKAEAVVPVLPVKVLAVTGFETNEFIALFLLLSFISGTAIQLRKRI